MNIQRFLAPTSREAMSKARRALGDSAVILSSRNTAEGFEVMAAAEESLASLTGAARGLPQPAVQAPAQPVAEPVARSAAPASQSVESDTEALAMSTLSFQDYVRERMLRKRREEMGAAAAPVQEAARPAERAAAQPLARPVAQPAAPAIPVQRFNAPTGPITMAPAPQPIRTREEAAWAHSEPARFPKDENNRMAVEISALREMIEERFNTLAWIGSSRQNPIQSQLMHKLIRAGYSPSMARAVLERVPTEAGPAEAVRWVMDVLTRNLKVAAPGAGLVEEGGVVALIGATGVGKTTTAAKMAAQCVKQYGAGSVGLITLDTYRVSGYEQLRTYGRMLGVVAHLAHDRAALKDLLNLLSGKRLVIIDTAGLGQRDQRIQDMLDVLDQPGIKKVMVLNAGAHGDTLDEVMASFKVGGLHGVVMSKVDEAAKLGPVLDALIRHQAVLRGVANGQRVPEDWQNPDAAALVRLSMGAQTKAAHDPVPDDLGYYFAQATGAGIQLGGARV